MRSKRTEFKSETETKPMTKQQIIELLQCALDSAKCGDDEMLDRCLIELIDGETR
jgi:type II secretory pathway predicted ATPase ExeA